MALSKTIISSHLICNPKRETAALTGAEVADAITIICTKEKGVTPDDVVSVQVLETEPQWKVLMFYKKIVPV